MVLGKLPVPGRPTNLDLSRARACCAYRTCEWGLFGQFFSHLSFLSSFSLSFWEAARYRLKYCLKGPLNPNQSTNNNSEIALRKEGILPLLRKVGILILRKTVPALSLRKVSLWTKLE